MKYGNIEHQGSDESDADFEARVRADAEAHLAPGLRYVLLRSVDDPTAMAWRHTTDMAEIPDWPLNGWTADIPAGVLRKRMIASPAELRR